MEMSPGTGFDVTNAAQTIAQADYSFNNPDDRYLYSGVQNASQQANAYANALSDIAAQNSALSQRQAREQMEFQRWSQLANMRYNSLEAAKNRDWQSYMSNTAHQREVRDLILAGLNPVLSAQNGNGAAVGSGATASSTGTATGAKGEVDTSLNQAIVSLLGSMINSQTQIANTAVTANNNMAISQLTNDTNKIINELTNRINLEMNRNTNLTNKEITEMNNITSRIVADISGRYGLAGSQALAGATAYAASLANEAQHYSADRTYELGLANPNSGFGLLGRVLLGLGVDLDNLGSNTGYSYDQIRDKVRNTSGKIIDFWSGVR